MTTANHEEATIAETTGFHKASDARVDAHAAMPQCPPPAAVAPTFPAGHASRYDSDLDELSVGLSSDDDEEDEEGRGSSHEDSGGWNSSTMNSWISNGDEGPRLVPPLSVDDEESACVKAVSMRPSSTLYLTSLPTDALHRMSLFLTAQELACVGRTSKRMKDKCADVWRRVRMHAARCLAEVVLAWIAGEHADARELAALYLQNGVPIYPSPHGHAYRTIVWRMAIEVNNMQNEHTQNTAAVDTTENYGSTTLDPFYSSRFLSNDEEPYSINYQARPPLTYVEEKSLFWKKQKGIPIEEPDGLSHSPSSTPTTRNRPFSVRGRRRTTLDGAPLGTATAARHVLRRPNAGLHGERPLRAMRRSSFASASPTSNAIATTPSSTLNTEKNDPKMTLRIHRHLADQHLFNLPSIQEENGNMHVGSMNLNADFFHPNIENSLRQRQQYLNGRRYHEWFSDETIMDETIRRERTQEGILDGLLNGVLPWENRGLDDDEENADRMVDWDLAGDLGLMNPHRATARAVAHASQDSMRYETPCSATHASPASDVALQMYSLSSPILRFDTQDNTNDALNKVRLRFAHYQRKLESCLASSSVQDFDNCLLDWWDETFPASAGIHFYNRQSPVPRMSHLQSFLTTPCPKAIGVVQCEIERVKISSKKKLFPTYEYRLFIRDVKSDNPRNMSHIPPREDSVLLVAKNKLRREKKGKTAHAKMDPSPPSESTSSKRGVTNYYMCLPQQRDVDLHYRSANKSSELAPGEKSGLAVSPLAAAINTPVTVGRVQGNFIGTEFQIFSPVMTKVTKAEGRASDLASSSDDSTDADPVVVPAAARRRASVDTPNPRNTHRGGNGLARMARRASLTMTRRPSVTARRPSMGRFKRQSMDPAEVEEELKSKASRRLSWTGNLPGGAKKTSRTKRSAIANSESEGHSRRGVCTAVEEEECGAITYTANLLGNRPRIMDVCVPKVMEDGSRCHAWKKVADTDADDGEVNPNNRMLTRFKAIQHQREQADAEALDDREGTTNYEIDDDGLMILQNRPPWWNVEIGAFVLNFGGRVSVASVKNFQLCERANQDQIMLQFGRIQGRHSFTMDFQYPLTPMQAFAIAISSLQSKISFG